MRNYLSIINRSLLYSFYAIFFLTPLVLFPKTLELFEFNKLFLVYGVSLFILFLWISKMILLGKFVFKRTPLDIPIALFIISQILSTIFSMDPYVSFWGYYTRFNGGLLSLIAYVFLYYAFLSNFLDTLTTEYEVSKKSKNADTTNEEYALISKLPAFKMLLVSLLSGLTVAVWGFSSHFGYDLTCLAFRGSLDVACWTDAFQPTIRLFSTLGQPNWLAAYFSILIPIALAIGIYKLITYFQEGYKIELSKKFLIPISFILLSFLLFIELLWSQSRSGYLGLLSGLFVFVGFTTLYFWRKKPVKKTGLFVLIPICAVFIILSVFLSNPLTNFSFLSVTKSTTQNTQPATPSAEASSIPALEGGGSDSGKIRLVVWTGALDLFKKNPLFGSGVETFAYGYYQVKPAEHNLLSEWDYLYNKAHNEYLNYLATTGIIGLSTYLLLIGWFIFICIKHLLPMVKQKTHNSPLHFLLITSLLSAYISVLVSNFFGFSVVIINVYFFFIPALVLALIHKQKEVKAPFVSDIPPRKTAGIILIAIIIIYFEMFLLNLWFADQDYSMGYNLNRAQEYVAANSYLENAVKLSPQEDLFKNELSLNLATLGVLLAQQNQGTQAADLIDRSVKLADEVVENHPKNVVFYKTRIQTFFVLSQVDPSYFKEALSSIKSARLLAPTDAKIAYNEGLLLGQNGQPDEAIKALAESIQLKPNYRDPRYATAIYLQEKAGKEEDPIKKEELLNNAKTQLEFILKNIDPSDTQSKELLDSLNKS